MKKQLKIFIICLISIIEIVPICLGFVFGSLNNDNNQTVNSKNDLIQTGLNLSESNISLDIDSTKDLIASTEVDNSTFIFQWTSSDEKIATLKRDENLPTKCIVKAIAEGETEIVVNVIDKNRFKVLDSASCLVTVTNNSIVLDTNEIIISLAESSTATVTATAPNNEKITWYSEDETIAKVDNGVITALKPGIVYIVAKTDYSEAKVLVKIYKSLFSLEETEVLSVGNRLQLSVKGEVPEDAEWISSNESIVIVDNNGYVQGVKKGMAMITLSSKEIGLSVNCIVMVKEGQENAFELLSGRKATAANDPGNWYYLCESSSVTIGSVPQMDNGLITLDITHVGKEDGTLSGNNFFYLRYQPDDVGDVKYKQTLYIYSENSSILAINGSEKNYKSGLNIISEDFTSAAPKDGNPFQIKFKTAGKYYIIPCFEEIGRTEKINLSHSSYTLDLTRETSFTITANVPGELNPEISWTSSNTDVATINNGVVTAHKKGSSMITAIYKSLSATCLVKIVDGTAISETELNEKNKSGVLENPGEWFYYVDGKSSLFNKPTINAEDNITLSVAKIDDENKKFVFLRYQHELIKKYKAHISIDFAGKDGSIVDITGGNQTNPMSCSLINGLNQYDFEFTSDNVNPFQLKFYSMGNYFINVEFSVIE